VRLRTDPDTRAYMARRTAQGKSRRDAKRCLRRVSPASCSGCWNATTNPASKSCGQLDSTSQPHSW
jgi:hypothetical protein